MKTTTYLINKRRSDGTVRLSVADRAEWLAVVKANRELPTGQRRYFIVDYIKDGTDLDCMVMEAPVDVYRVWIRGYMAEKRNRETGKGYQLLSADAPAACGDGLGLLDTISAGCSVEEYVCGEMLLADLREALATWKPWANDLLDVYLQGKKRSCTEFLSQKYSVSPQVIRKYKRQFEDFIKNFLGSVSF